MGGYGPGMMGGYGPGMMGGYGPGMMGGYGPGMMGGYGPGMMGGYGPGMIGGYGMGVINLSDEQIHKMQKIRSDQMAKMTSVMDEMWRARNDLYKAAQANDKKAMGKAYDELASVRKQAFMLRAEMREKMDSILTKEQKENLRNAHRGMIEY
jgi:Spy/CpxP family protein refolding chaperone